MNKRKTIFTAGVFWNEWALPIVVGAYRYAYLAVIKIQIGPFWACIERRDEKQ